MNLHLPEDWYNALKSDIESPYFAELQKFVAVERQNFDIYPSDPDLFMALQLTPLNSVRVVIIGQDPYHNEGQAHGLSFSVRNGVAKPPSLKNIMREYTEDIGCQEPKSGCLNQWAENGVLLLNTVLTVRAHQPNSHRGRGWERFTDSIIRAVNDRHASCVFLLWGAAAQRKSCMLNIESHVVIDAPHPSPLSAHTGFFGSRPFSRANDGLVAKGLDPVDWRLEQC